MKLDKELTDMLEGKTKMKPKKKTITYTELGSILTKALDKLHAFEIRHIPAKKSNKK